MIAFLLANGVGLELPSPDLVGKRAEVISTLGIRGKIMIDGKEYVARPEKRQIKKGALVKVSDVRGTSIYARRIDDEPMDSQRNDAGATD